VRLTVDGSLTDARRIRIGGGESGLHETIFAAANFTGPVSERDGAEVELGRDDAGPFSARWTGKLKPRYSETYHFNIETDGRAVVYIGELLFMDTAWTRTGVMELMAGEEYDVRVEYQHTSGPAFLEITWGSDSQARSAMPSTIVPARRRALR
jgi:hypothetical protein